MSADQGPELLNAHFGTQSPHWRLAFDSNALELSAVKGKAHVAVALSAMDAAKIRRLTGVTASLELTITLAGEPLHLHLVGRRVNNLEWAGTASAFSDTQSVARDLVHGLSFAEQVVSEANSVIVIVDQHGRIQRFNRLSEEYTGLHEHEVIGKNVFQLFMSPEEAAASRRNIAGFFRNGSSYEVERWVKTVKGERLFLFRNKFVHSGSGKNEVFLICSGTDITEERRAQERLRVLANTDIITGLPNRNAIQDKINHAIATRGEESFGLVYLDLDNFKKVNDAYGHMFGDRLLVEVSLAILGCLSPDQVLARLGGDEFLVLAPQTDREHLQTLAQRIIDRLKTPFRIGLIEVYTGCSIGIALCPEHGNDLDSLIRSADTAMYVAKEHGKRTYTVFSPEMNKRVAEYMWLDTNLRKGLEQNQLVLYYQPKIDARSGEVHSVEALVRWDSPERGLIPPRVTVKSLEPLPSSAGEQRFRIALFFDNMSTEPLKIRGVEFKLRLADQGIIDGTAGAMVLEALDQQTVTVDVSSEIVSSLSRLMSFAEGPDNTLAYEIFGKLTLERFRTDPLEFAGQGRAPLVLSSER